MPLQQTRALLIGAASGRTLIEPSQLNSTLDSQKGMMMRGFGDRRRRVVAALVANAGIYDTEPVGRLTGQMGVAVGLPMGACDIRASVTDGIHLSLSRGFEGDANWAVRHLSSVISEPTHFAPLNERSRFSLAALVEGRALHIVVKYVPPSASASGEPELWLQTAHPLGDSTWSRYQRNGRLKPVAESARGAV